jgi:two-component system sensor histidine kinase DesK
MYTKDAISKQRARNWAWIWLAYTGFLFINPIMEPSLFEWVGTLIVFASFLVIFFFYVRVDDESAARYWLIGLTFLLGLATFPWNGGGSTFFIYAASFCAFSIASARRVLWLFLFLCLSIYTEGYLFGFGASLGVFHVGLANTLVAIFLVVVIGGSNIFFAQQKRSDCKLREAQAENLALAAVAERERIARDLHDVLGHTLSVIVLKAELAGRLLERDPQRATSEINDVECIARTALAEVREAIGGYRARGLGSEIEAARRTLDAAGVTLTSEGATNIIGGLSAAEETALALALREAVTNIVRHARATTCQLRFVREGNHRRLIVEDDGQNANIREGNGLRGMRERIESLGGQLSLESTQGTRLLIDLPLHVEGLAT